MDPTSAPQPDDIPAAVLGELVVGNGRLIGTRRALAGPLTLVGDGTGCDVRLHHDKVAPFHCALFHGPHGFVLRDLAGSGQTLVNGQPVETQALHHGDRIEIGPFHLVLELPDGDAGPAGPTDADLEAEREALRVQAAAVVAQQAALTEEEIRLQQRRGGLERQEAQLADHLEEKRRSLVELREQLKAERDAFRADRAAEERKLQARHQEAEAAFAESDEERKLSQKERARFVELRKRLKRRWDEHFAAHEAGLRRREDELNAAADRLSTEAEKLDRERASLSEERLRHNGEVELGRRQLEADWDELSLSQQEWELCLNREKADYDTRNRTLAEREEEVAKRERQLADGQRTWEQVKAGREQESEGLEHRIRNQRLKLQTLEQSPANQGPAALPAVTIAPPPPLLANPSAAAEERVEPPVALKRLAGDLADQRLHVLDQWRSALEVQDHWQTQRDAVLDELEDSGRRLADRERQLVEREQQVTARAVQFEQREQMLAQLRGSLEARQARITAGAQEWQADRARVLAEAQAEQDAAAARIQRLDRLCRRTRRRHHADAEALHEARVRCEEARSQYVDLWQECRSRTEAVVREQQTLAGDTLALERLRLEVLAKAEDAAAAEKRLEKLRRQSQTLVERAERELERQRAALGAEAARLQERGQALQQDEERVIAWRRKLAKRQRRYDEGQSAVHEAAVARAQGIQRLLAQHQTDVKNLTELRDEVERLARLMMDETGEGNTPSTKAA
jgi:pSer/pThr/pTyr-binding forkhead associated (FHA) protein